MAVDCALPFAASLLLGSSAFLRFLPNDFSLIFEPVQRVGVEFVSKPVEYLEIASIACCTFFGRESGGLYLCEGSPIPGDLNWFMCFVN